MTKDNISGSLVVWLPQVCKDRNVFTHIPYTGLNVVPCFITDLSYYRIGPKSLTVPKFFYIPFVISVL